MINRYYICDNCDHHMVVKQKMDATLKKKCPKCGQYKLYQDLMGQHTFVYQEPKTLGHLGDRNRERMGKYELESKERDHSKAKRAKKKKPTWYNAEGANLKEKLKDINTPEKKHKYIMEGK